MMIMMKRITSNSMTEWKTTTAHKSHHFIHVRIMSRASHRNTDKWRVNQVNENSKVKSEIYWDAKTICTEEREALSSIES